MTATPKNNVPQVTDRATWQARLDELLIKEKAHTRMGDALAAERRRLPMVEIDPNIKLISAKGPVPLIDAFEGRSQLLAYFHMWHQGKPTPEQCEGCTFFTTHIQELSYLHSRDVSYATFCQGPYEESARYRDFMGWTMTWYSVPPESAGQLLAGRYFGMLVSYLRDGDKVYETYWTTGRGVEVMAPSYGLMDLTVYGRQEHWEKSPEGWPQDFDPQRGAQFRLNGRPTAQWSRVQAGRNEDLGTAPSTGSKSCCHSKPYAAGANLLESDMREQGLVKDSWFGLIDHCCSQPRRVACFKVVPYDIQRGCAAAYFPESHVLVPAQASRGKQQPASKSLVISIEPSATPSAAA